MTTFNRSEAAVGNDELYLASLIGDHYSIYIFMQQNMSTTLRCRRNSRRFEAGFPEQNFPNRTMHG